MARNPNGNPDQPRLGAAEDRLDRRRFLKQGAALAGATTATGAMAVPPGIDLPWLHVPGQPFSAYGKPSPHERYTARRIGANRAVAGNGVSFTPLEDLEGTITPNGLHFERHHNGVPQIDPAQHRLVVHGRVRQPLSFDVKSLLRYPMHSQLLFIECGGNSNAGWHAEPIQRPAGSVHGLVSCAEWTGVPLSILLDEAGVDPEASWVIAEGADAGAMNMSIPLGKMRDDCLIGLYQNGERLRPENGYPMRLIVPGWEGVLHVKWLQRLEVADQPVMSRNETSKYTELLPSGKARQFTFTMGCKSLITTPSHGQTLRQPDVYQISGLAWSGHGRIARVEVSADNGRQWIDAALQSPALPRCFTRFRLPWRWDGKPAVLKSRATDEAGNVQPERAALIAERGRAGYFHYHAIVAWAVEDDGLVSHIY
ncbi:MAG: sulfite dehydrogenase [Pseudomonadota bacterium]